MSLPAHYTEDPAAKAMGIQLEEVRPGFAQVRLTITPQHLNGHGTVHGGVLFMLADTAFAYACNSRGVKTVGTSCHISYSAPSSAGDTLTAVAEEEYLNGRTGIYDVRVRNQKEEAVAHFRGHSFAPKT